MMEKRFEKGPQGLELRGRHDQNNGKSIRRNMEKRRGKWGVRHDFIGIVGLGAFAAYYAVARTT